MPDFYFCAANCVPDCVCINGYIRQTNQGACVPNDQCPGGSGAEKSESIWDKIKKSKEKGV
jgi:hypothetical protein